MDETTNVPAEEVAVPEMTPEEATPETTETASEQTEEASA
jgi:hypothetical protein